MSNETPLRIETPRKGIRRLVMDLPERRHTVTNGLRQQIFQAVLDADNDPAIRAIVLTGSGGHFSGGGDLNRISKIPMDEFSNHMDFQHRLLTLLANCGKPFIAAIEGVVAGAGVGHALAADMIVLGTGGYFVFPFFKIGLVPDAAVLYHLPRRVGPAGARRMLFKDKPVRAEEAERTGLVDLVVADDRVQEEALDQAERLAAISPMAFRFTKRMLATDALPLADILREETMTQTVCIQSPEFKAGVEAFLSKRK